MAATPEQPDAAVMWVPRPAVPDEPVCWSWPVPPLLAPAQVEARVLELALRYAARPDPDERLDVDVVRSVHGGDPRRVRWREFHDGRCAGCGGRARLVVDHEHATGLERGLLCHPCNVSEGAGVVPWVLRYRERPPAVILGHVRYYTGPRGWDVVYGDGGLWYEDTRRARRLTGNPRWEPAPGADWT